MASSRWKPTPIQLEILEELYCKSVGNLNDEQIHDVANFLRRYGEIQAKSVFYWFKNRKFNDRLYKRRRLDEAIDSVTSKLTQTKLPDQIAIERSPQKMIPIFGNETSTTRMTNLSSKAQKEKTKTIDNCSIEDNTFNGNNDSFENIQLPWRVNKNLRKRGWALARINRSVEETHDYMQSGEHQYRNEAMKTLQLFPLKPINT